MWDREAAEPSEGQILNLERNKRNGSRARTSPAVDGAAAGSLGAALIPSKKGRTDAPAENGLHCGAALGRLVLAGVARGFVPEICLHGQRARVSVSLV